MGRQSVSSYDFEKRGYQREPELCHYLAGAW